MIKSITQKRGQAMEIDLTGPDGNAFCLINIAMEIAKDKNKKAGSEIYNIKDIQTDMFSGDYEHLIDVMEKHFGEFIIMYR